MLSRVFDRRHVIRGYLNLIVRRFGVLFTRLQGHVSFIRIGLRTIRLKDRVFSTVHS